MITTGWPYSNGAHTEVLDLLNPTSNCAPGLEFPVEIQGATGGLVDKTPIICGGWNGTFGTFEERCFVMNSDSFHTFPLLKERWYSSCVTIDNELWITGGSKDISSEIIKLG